MKMFTVSVWFFLFFSYCAGLEVNVDLRDVLVQVKPEFLSVTIDSAILSPPKWETFNFRYVCFIQCIILVLGVFAKNIIDECCLLLFNVA